MKDYIAMQKILTQTMGYNSNTRAKNFKRTVKTIRTDSSHPQYEKLRALENEIGELKQRVLRMADRGEINETIERINLLESEYTTILENPDSLLDRSDFPKAKTAIKEVVVMDKCPYDNTKLEVHPTYLDKTVMYCPTCFASFKGGKKI